MTVQTTCNELHSNDRPIAMKKTFSGHGTITHSNKSRYNYYFRLHGPKWRRLRIGFLRQYHTQELQEGCWFRKECRSWSSSRLENPCWTRDVLGQRTGTSVVATAKSDATAMLSDDWLMLCVLVVRMTFLLLEIVWFLNIICRFPTRTTRRFEFFDICIYVCVREILILIFFT